MFVEKISVKNKNFLKILDALALCGKISRAELSKRCAISPATLSSALEILLDFGIVCEEFHGKSSRFYITDNVLFTVFDLCDRNFVAYMMTLSGDVVYSMTYRYSDAYFFDENVSVFMKSFVSKISPAGFSDKVCAVAVIKNGYENFKSTTRSILGSYERLSALIRGYFGETRVLVEDNISMAVKNVSLRADSAPCFIISQRARDLLCTCFHDDESYTTGILRCEERSHIASGSNLADFCAKAIGNLVSVIKPKKILFDRLKITSERDFAREFVSKLNVFLSEEVCSAEVVICDEPLFKAGIAKAVRHAYFENLLNIHKTAVDKND